MTTTAKATYPDWIDSLTSLIEDLRHLDIRIDNDTRLEPAPAGGDPASLGNAGASPSLDR